MKWFARLHSNFNALATLWDTYLLCLNRNAVKQVSDVLICSANNVTDHYGKMIEVLHRHPFEGWPDMARPSHSFWQKLADWLNWLLFFPIRTFLAFIRGIIWVEILVITLVFSPKQPCLMYYFAHDRRAWIFLCCENCRNISWKCRCMKIRILLRTWFQPSALGKREQRILNLISLENAPHTTLALFLLDNLVCLSFVHYKRKCQWATRLFVFVRTKPIFSE